MRRLYVSAAHRSSGKTTVALGLAAALAAEGTTVQPFKKGPDYIDPMWLGLAAGRPCRNLDPHLERPDALLAAFARLAAAADLALVEGNMGLHDGLALDGSDSNAALARLLGAPVLLVLDARGMTRGIAALVLGMQAFDRTVRIGGVVLNRVGGARHESKLRAAIERYTDVPVLGAIAEDERLAMSERHLGLVPCAEVDAAVAQVQAIGHAVAAQVDLRRVREIAAAAPALAMPATAPLAVVAASPCADPASPLAPSRVQRNRADLRIGIARDRAFGFYYADDLAALERAGAGLVFIDTLHDTRLPALDGLVIGGGFPETSLDALAANAPLRAALREAIEGGLPTYAECGGLMYLARSITWRDRTVPMVGVIPGDAVMRTRAVGRGYVELQETDAMPWSGGGGSSAVQGHEFHHSSLENLDPDVRFAYRVQRGHGVDGRHDGLVLRRLLASYAHLRDDAGAAWVSRFVDFVRRSRAERVSPAVLAA